MELSAYAIPAIVALCIKVVIYFYVQPSAIRNPQTRLFLLFLITLSLHNVAEITYFLREDGLPLAQPPGGYLFFGASIIALAIALHLALMVAHDWRAQTQRRLMWLYVPALVLEGILWFTPWLITGFTQVMHTFRSVPGPLYFAFELYVLAFAWAVIGALILGALRQTTSTKRLRCRLLLLGLLPMGLVVTVVVTVQHYLVWTISSTFILPICITFFLIVAGYAIHQFRLFDISFFIPGSRLRRRKTAFYGRIQALIGEIARLNSVNTAIDSIADTLHCPVALIGNGKSVLAPVSGSQAMVDIPKDVLQRCNHIMVANEIVDAEPETCATMRRHGIAAIVPFYPSSRNASGWLLLGNSFSDQIYSPVDFREVEQLFDKMGELFLDELLGMRSELATAARRFHALTQQSNSLQATIDDLEHRNTALEEENQRLLRTQPADAVDPHRSMDDSLPGRTITLLSRDKPLRDALRRYFPQLQSYVGPQSAGFKRFGKPDVVACEVTADVTAPLRQLVARRDNRHAILLYGKDALRFVAANEDQLRGKLVEVMPEDYSQDALARRIQALANLTLATHAVSTHHEPLIGRTRAFRMALQDLSELAGFDTPVWLHCADAGQVVAAANYLHGRGSRTGTVRRIEAHDASIFEPVHAAPGAATKDTWVVTDLASLPPTQQRQLVTWAHQNGSAPYLVLGCALPPGAAIAGGLVPADVVKGLGASIVAIPRLSERSEDAEALIYYFTLQYNLRSGATRYPRRNDLEVLLQHTASVAELEQAVYGLLRSMPRTAAAPAWPETDAAQSVADGGRPLDERVARFEANIIRDALNHCHGNKAQAARLLGLRPNTLHYKLERYGITADTGGDSNKD